MTFLRFLWRIFGPCQHNLTPQMERLVIESRIPWRCPQCGQVLPNLEDLL